MLVEHGEWHDTESLAPKEFAEKFIEPLDDDTVLTLIDCHC